MQSVRYPPGPYPSKEGTPPPHAIDVKLLILKGHDGLTIKLSY